MAFCVLKKVLSCHMFLLCLITSEIFFLPYCTRAEITANKEVVVLGFETDVPKWKSLWDMARAHYRAEKYPEAASLYSELFKLKPDIEQANWEFCKVLQKTGDFKMAGKLIVILLDKDHHRIEYLLAGGQIASQNKEWEAAGGYYGQVLEKDPGGETTNRALEGLQASLRNNGKIGSALSIAEMLLARQPDNLKLLQDSARDAKRIGETDKSRKLFRRILAKHDVDDLLLLEAIQVLDTQGNEAELSILWENYLKKHPGYLEFRHKLVDYYMGRGEYHSALEHLVYLADNVAENDLFLEKAGDVNLYQLGRPDKALSFFERYLLKNPESSDIKKKIVEIQYILANDFLSIVENDGAWLLWRDLAKVTPNREAIYLQMADLLASKGLDKEYLEILTVIQQHRPDDELISMRLAQKYYELNHFENALKYLEKIKIKNHLTKDYYVLRAQVENKIGKTVEALRSQKAALLMDPSDVKLRIASMELAGLIGNTPLLEMLFREGMKSAKRASEAEILFTYLDQLSKNCLFKEYEAIRNRYRSNYIQDQNILDRMDFHWANTLRREGKTREAEELLRKLLTQNRLTNEVFYMLANNALADKNIKAATAWYDGLLKNRSAGKSELTNSIDDYRLMLLKIRITRAEGDFNGAEDLVTHFQKFPPNGRTEKEILNLQFDIEKERAWLNYYLDKFTPAMNQLERLDTLHPLDPDVYVLQSLLQKKHQRPISTQFEKLNLHFSTDHLVTNLPEIIERNIVHQNYDEAENLIKILLRKCPETITGRILLAKLLFSRGRFNDAEEPLQQLYRQFPKERYFSHKLIEIEVRRGNYIKGLALLEENHPGINSQDSPSFDSYSSDDVEDLLTLARLLWGAKQQDTALQIYRKLLSPSVLQLLREKLSKKEINYLYLTREKTIWNSMLLLLQSEPEILAELMEPSFLCDNVTNDAGKIVTDHFQIYSWQKMIDSEYVARNAIYEKKFTVAEQNYKKMVDEQRTPEGLIDLAEIYGRIGKYRKEAQIYEAIQNTGTTSPELEKSMERNSLQLSPQNIIDAALIKRDGRDRFVDIETLSVGSSFWFTPDFDTDIRLAYANNRYRSVHSTEATGSNSLNGTTIYELTKDYELILGAGIEKMDGTSNTRFLQNLTLKGQLDDYFHAYLKYEKVLVDDTVLALKHGISQQEFEAGLYCESALGLTFGSDFRHRNYSDNNTQNRFHGYSSYRLFGESIQLSLRYDYQFLKNTETNPNISELIDKQEPYVTYYWSPSSFSENLFTLHFQHDFLEYEQGEKRKISYYTIANAIGYDDLETLSYLGEFNIFLEMNPHFLLKGGFTILKSDNLQEQGLSFSLHYRW